MRSAIITICLIYMIAIVFSFVFKLIKNDREGRLRLVKGYAKGRFVLIYIVAVPLFMMAFLYEGAGVIASIFGAVEESVNLVVLKLDYGVIASLAESDSYYFATMVILFVLCVANAIMFTLGLFYQRICNFVYKKIATQSADTTYVVVGKNIKNRDILLSTNGAKVWIIEEDKKDAELEDFAYINKIAIVRIKEDSLSATLKGLFGNFFARSIRVVVNTGSDETNLLMTEEISDLICSLNTEDRDIDDAKGLHLYAFGEPENSSAFLHFVKKTAGQIRYINKYKLIALDFVDKHPLTEFMDDNEIDTTRGVLKADIEPNVVMIGYNKTMQEVLVTSVANNQFMYLDENGKLQERQVRYTIFTGDKKGADKNLNHSFLRYSFERKQMLAKKEEYLPLPEFPAKVDFVSVGTNDYTFYESVKRALSQEKEGNKPFNQIIVSWGTDIENIDIAEKLSVKVKEWGMDDKTEIFVKVRSYALQERIIKDEYKDITRLHTFATEKMVVYNLDRIISENIETMARDRHLAYAVCDAIQDGKDEHQTKVEALKKWYGWAQPQRDANVYGVLSIRMKLNLLGYDYIKGQMDSDLAQAFMSTYQEGDPIKYKAQEVGGKKIVEYTNDFKEGSLRQRLAIHEHLRWNSYMITQGVVPSSIKEMQKEGGKNLTLRRHGCLTSFDGLKEYRQIMAERNGTNQESEDVIRYDYQLFDDLIWLLERNGNTLIKR